MNFIFEFLFVAIFLGCADPTALAVTASLFSEGTLNTAFGCWRAQYGWSNLSA